METVLWWVGLAANVIGVVGIVPATLAWLAARRTERALAAERARQEERIDVLLVLEAPEARPLRLPVHLRRRDLTRAELLGRLGMLPMRQVGARFGLRYLSDPAFLAQLDEAQSGQRAIIYIPATADEVAQFAL